MTDCTVKQCAISNYIMTGPKTKCVEERSGLRHAWIYTYVVVDRRILLSYTDTRSKDCCLHGPEKERIGNINFEAGGHNKACISGFTVEPNECNDDCNVAMLQTNSWSTCGSVRAQYVH